MEKVALIGLGPHAKRIYYPYLVNLIENDENFTFELLIDLESNRADIEKFLSEQRVKPRNLLFLDPKKQIVPNKIDPLARKSLKNYKISKAIISTEPKAHKIYLKECIKQGIPVVVDKPITACKGIVPRWQIKGIPSKSNAKNIYKDVAEIQKQIEKVEKSRVLVQCQRRNHRGYEIVRDVAKDIVDTYNIPITYINIHHSDGMWNMPDEFLSRENHPYKYGYGKIMHSGYHFVDLLVSLVDINANLSEKQPDKIELFNQAVRPYDQHQTISFKDYEDLFGVEETKHFKSSMTRKELDRCGEVDSFSQIRISKNNKVITTAQLSLMQTGFSQRAWTELPKDTYKSNGRVRHESVNIHIGPLCNIQVHSYQSTEIASKAGKGAGVGDKNHFDIYIFRNSNLIGGKPFEHIKFGDSDMKDNTNSQYLGHNEEARCKTLDELMYNLPSNSELKQHLTTNRLITAIYKTQVKQVSDIIPYSKYKFKDIF